MSRVLDQLLSLLKLETIEQGLYRGQSQDLGFHSVFGGQVIGQAISAAKETVDAGRRLHSFHSYFLRPGDASKPIIYDVDSIRDGRTMSTRRVKAIQNGQPIFYLTASFQVLVDGLEHQDAMPEVAQPEALMPELDIALQYADKLPQRLREKWLCDKPLEMRPVDPSTILLTEPIEGKRYTWFRANGQMPDDHRVHMYLLAYASDFNFLPTALQPHGQSLFNTELQIATVDHAMWFHHEFRLDDWLLYAVDSPVASGGRALVRGQFYTREGKLVASTIQEGVMRKREPRQKSAQAEQTGPKASDGPEKA